MNKGDLPNDRRSETQPSAVIRLVELMQQPVLLRDAGGRITFWNKGAERLFGYTPAEALGRTCRELLQPQFLTSLQEIDATLANEGEWCGDLVYRTKDGRSVVVQAHWTLDPQEGSVLETVIDMTQQRETERSLRAQEELLAGIIERIPVMLTIYDPALRSFRFNRHLRETIGWTEAEASDGDFMAKVYPNPEYRARVIRHMQAPGDRWEDFRITAKSGEEFPTSWANARLSNDTTIGIGIDLRERERASEALRASERRYHELFENMVEGFFLAEVICKDGVPVDYRYIDVNPALEQLTNTRRDEIVGRTVREVFPTMEEHWISVYGEVALTGIPARFSEYAKPFDRYYETTAYSPRKGYFACLFTDVTDRKRAELALRNSEERYRTLFDKIDEGFCIVQVMFDAEQRPVDARYLEVNPSFGRHTGLGDVVGKRMREVVPNVEPAWIETFGRIAASGIPERFQRPSADTQRWYDVYAFRIGAPELCEVAFLFTDITTRRRSEEELQTTSRKLQATLDSIADGLLVMDREWRYTYFSETAARIIRVRREDMLGKVVWDLFPNAHGTLFYENYQRAMATGEPQHFEEYYPEPLNQWLECHCYPSEEGLTVYFRDVTARRRAQEELRRTTTLLHAISDHTGDAIFSKDRDGRLTYANPATLALVDKPADKVIGKTDAEFLEDKDAARRVMENDARIMTSGRAEDIEEFIPAPDGTMRVWFSRKVPYCDPSGRVIGLLGVSRDITERKAVDEALRAANQRLKTVLDSITDGLAVLDRDWRYTYFSEQAGRVVGMKPEDLLGRTVWELFPKADELQFGKAYRQAVSTGKTVHFEEYYPEPLDKWIECHCYPSAEGLSVFFRDVTDRKRAQEELKESQEKQLFLATALQKASQPFGAGYPDGRLMMFNDAFATLTGYSREELDGMRWADGLTPPEWRDHEARLLEQLHATGEPQSYEKEYLRKDGTRVPVEIKVHLVRDAAGAPVCYYAFVTDLTERRRAQETLIRTEKLASAGRLAAAIAHEINNPLDAVMNTLFLARNSRNEPDVADKYLEIADAELKRVAHITRQSLGFYRESAAPAVCDVRSVVDSVFDVLRSKIRHKRASVVNRCREGVRISTVPGELRQILANLVGNSLDAVAENGSVTVRLSVTGRAAGRANLRILVVDNGCGISREARSRIFEPFFTTKGTVGTGLGLWVTRQLVEKHGGSIRVRSREAGPFHGTAFAITLPVGIPAREDEESARIAAGTT